MVSKSTQWARQWVTLSAQRIGENREVLIDLDRQIGDGDHGENMDRGFSAVMRGDGLSEVRTPAEVLKYVAKTLMSTVGGAAGPLYGTAYLRAAAQMPDQDMSAADIQRVLSAAVGGIQARGKATAGEKTMVDAWLPAVEASRNASEEQHDLLQTWGEVAEAAEMGAQATRPMKATKGRASYLGDRSIGHLDPGAVSTALILESAFAAAQDIYGGDND